MFEIVTAIVLIMFGILIGLVLQIASRYENRREVLWPHEDEHFIAYMRRILTGWIILSPPRSFWIAALGFYILIAMLIGMLYYTSLQMNWLIFLVSLFGGFGIAEYIYNLAIAGKIKVTGETFLDISVREKSELETEEDQSYRFRWV